MSNRQRVGIPWTLKHEGGFVDHPNDPGGATNFGVSLRALRQLEGDNLGDWDLDGDGDVDAQDMRLMRVDQAVGFYEEHFWYAELDALTSPVVAVKLFDMGVNMGRRQAGRLFQRALNRNAEDLVVDGAVGPMTVAAENRVNRSWKSNDLLQDLVGEQAAFYFRLVDSKPSREVFLLGWLRRAYAVPEV